MGVSDRAQQQPQAPWRGGGPLVAPSGSTEVREWVSEGKECEHQRICTPDVSGCHAASKHSRWWTARDWMASPSCPQGTCWRRKEETGGKRRGEIRRGRRGEEELGLKKERRGICTEGPEPRSSHPEDPCSLAGWLQQRQAEERGKEKKTTRGRYREGGLGLIVTLLSFLSVASKGAPAASVNFRLAQTCELLGANWNMNWEKGGWEDREGKRRDGQTEAPKMGDRWGFYMCKWSISWSPQVHIIPPSSGSGIFKGWIPSNSNSFYWCRWGRFAFLIV